MPPTNFTPPTPKEPPRPFWRWVRALGTTVAMAVPALITIPTIQVLGLHIVTPRTTLTMLGRSQQALLDGENPRIRSSDVHWFDVENMARAVVSSEDGRFFLHQGIDRRGVCAAWKSNQNGGRLRGGSSITQQVARNVFLWQARSWTRKGLEVVYTGYLELLLGKERTLDLYLSVAETGPMTFGVEAGADLHYGKSARDLSSGEAARIAYLFPNPRARSVRASGAATRARWITRNPGVFPDHPRFEDLRSEARSRPVFPLCP